MRFSRRTVGLVLFVFASLLIILLQSCSPLSVWGQEEGVWDPPILVKWVQVVEDVESRYVLALSSSDGLDVIHVFYPDDMEHPLFTYTLSEPAVEIQVFDLYIVILYRSGSVQVYEIMPDMLLQHLLTAPRDVGGNVVDYTDVEFAPDGKVIAVAGEGVILFMEGVPHYIETEGETFAMAWSPDGQRFAYASAGRVHVEWEGGEFAYPSEDGASYHPIYSIEWCNSSFAVAGELIM